MALRLLWYYLAILIIPTITTTIIYFTTREALLDVQKEKANVALTDAVNQYEQELAGIRNIATYLSSDTTIIDLAKGGDALKNDIYYTMYQSCDEFPKYTLTNSMIGDICVWFTNQPYVMSVPGVFPKTDRAVSTIPALRESKVWELQVEFGGEYHYMEMNLGNGDTLNSTQIRVVHSLSSTKGDRYDGAVAISLDVGVLNKLLRSIRPSVQSSVFLLDERENIVRAFTENEYEIGAAADTSWEEYVQESNIERGAYTYKTISDDSGWSFVVVIPVAELTSEIGGVKYFTGFLYVLSIVAGCFICLYYWYRNRKMVSRYCEFAENLPMRETVKSGKQEFWKSFELFLEQIENMQSTFTKQEQIVQTESIRKLLLGRYRNISEFEEENVKMAVKLKEQTGFYVDVVRFENQMVGEFLLAEEEIQERVESLFSETLNLTHWIYAIDRTTYALILAADGEESIVHVDNELSTICLQGEAVGGGLFVGISPYVEEILNLSEAYEYAMDICKSASFFQMHMPLMKEMGTEEVHSEVLTREKELQIEQTVLCGSENDLEALLIQIRESNIEQLQHQYWMTHMMNTLQSILIRYLKKCPDDWNKEMIIKSQKAEWPDELFLLLRMAKRHQVMMEESQNDRLRQEVKDKLESFIQKEFSNESFNLAVLAEYMEMPEQKLYKEFKLYFGVTFSDYLENVRIMNACRLLKQGVAVKDVTLQVGYNSDYSFRRAFKRSTGVTPSAYMKM